MNEDTSNEIYESMKNIFVDYEMTSAEIISFCLAWVELVCQKANVSAEEIYQKAIQESRRMNGFL